MAAIKFYQGQILTLWRKIQHNLGVSFLCHDNLLIKEGYNKRKRTKRVTIYATASLKKPCLFLKTQKKGRKSTKRKTRTSSRPKAQNYKLTQIYVEH